MPWDFFRLRPPSIFISYRREDTGPIVGRILDRLTDLIRKPSPFFDIEDHAVGSRFREAIEQVLQRCDVVLAVIGPQWAGKKALDRTRLQDDGDVLRAEIEIALRRRIVVIPVLIDDTAMPNADQIPSDLRLLTELQAARVSSGRDFGIHVRRLFGAIEERLGVGILYTCWRFAKRRPVRTVLTISLVVAALLVGLYLQWPREHTVLPDRESAISPADIKACNNAFTIACAQSGAAFGSAAALAALRACKQSRVIRSDEPWLQWKDIWTTSVYSFAPQGGGPGGGKDDESLRVGGWGDWYFTLIKFDLPQMQQKPQLVAVALYSKDNEGSSVPLAVDRIIHPWDFPKGGTLWWKDRPDTGR